MNLLVLGGCHTYGYGLADNPSFIDLFIRHYQQQGDPVSLTCYALVDLHRITTRLAALPLPAYDLIVLQLGHYRLQHPSAFTALLKPTPPPSDDQDQSLAPLTADTMGRLRHTPVGLPPAPALSLGERLKTMVKLGLLRGLSTTRQLTRLNEVNADLHRLLTLLQPHRQRTVLLTPFPHQEPVSQFMRQRGRQLFLKQGQAYGLPVFDTNRVIRPCPAYFLTNDPGHLNAVGHALLGHDLYAFCRAHCTGETACPTWSVEFAEHPRRRVALLIPRGHG